MKTVRITTSLPEGQYEKLQQLAKNNNLSLSWLVRQAISEFLKKVDHIEDFYPLSKEPPPGKH